MDQLRGPFNRRTFLKRSIGTATVLTSIPMMAKVPSASAAEATIATSDLSEADQFTVVNWQGPNDAVVQLRRLNGLGVWSDWQTLELCHDNDAEGERSPSSGLIRTEGARALQARSLTDGVTDLTITRVSGN